MLQHHAAVGRVYAALRLKIESRPKFHFEDWLSEHDFQRHVDTVAIHVPHDDGTRHAEETGIEPNGAFFIARSCGWPLVVVEYGL